MGVSISPEARKYLDEKGVGAISLGITALKIGCCGVLKFKDVEVSLGEPDNVEGFWRRHVDGVAVFVDKRLDPGEQVTVKHQKLWLLSFLYADGAGVIY